MTAMERPMAWTAEAVDETIGADDAAGIRATILDYWATGHGPRV